MEPNKHNNNLNMNKNPFFPSQLPHLTSGLQNYLAPLLGNSVLQATGNGTVSPFLLSSMVVPPPPQLPSAALGAAVSNAMAAEQQKAQVQRKTSPSTPKGAASIGSADGFSDDESSDSDGVPAKKKLRGREDSGEKSGDDEQDKTKKRREQIAAASRASRARRKRELEDLRAETKQLRDEREKLLDTIRKLQRKVEDLQQRPVIVGELVSRNGSSTVVYPNVLIEIGARSAAVVALMTILRDKNCSKVDFVTHSDRLCRILVEEGLARCKLMSESRIQTPTDAEFLGLAYPDVEKECCTVSIMRSGDIIADVMRAIIPTVSVGKMLIQRQEDSLDKHAVLYWAKLPHDISQRFVFVCDPMLGTGGSVTLCIKELVRKGVSPKNIMFLNIVSCPEGLMRLYKEFPEIPVVTCAVDPALNEKKYIIPGLGDYGDRYFHTTHSM